MTSRYWLGFMAVMSLAVLLWATDSSYGHAFLPIAFSLGYASADRRRR